jgi:NAD(P)-dependent dehydrogenase (short-subunit alcohol dehydrogenase family)
MLLEGRSALITLSCSGAAVEAAVVSCVTEFGCLDIMVNNAGITRDATLRKIATFLASDMSSYITAAVIEVTGGRHA